MDIDWRALFAEIGNGDINAGAAVVTALAHRLTHARESHNWHCCGVDAAMSALHGEVDELALAVRFRNRHDVRYYPNGASSHA